jgi:hypothetical protein
MLGVVRELTANVQKTVIAGSEIELDTFFCVGPLGHPKRRWSLRAIQPIFASTTQLKQNVEGHFC